MEVPDTRYATVGDAQVAYQVLGDGPIDLVYHHGFCHVDLQWDVASEASFNRALATFARVILFDRRGSGASDRMPYGRFPTWEEWNRDLLAVLDAVGSESVALFAEAEAGPMALMFAAAHPERVKALVLGNMAARLSVGDDYPIGLPTEQAEHLASRLESLWGSIEGVGAMFPGLADRPADVAAIARLCRAAATPRIAGAQYRQIHALDARSALGLVRAPTLVVVGRCPLFEALLPGYEERARFVAQQIQGAQYCELPSQSALFFGGEFQPLVEAVAEFLTGYKPAASSDRVLTTVLFTDIVGSTERAASIGDRRWHDLLDAHDELIRHELRRFGGREVKTTGDGFLACFDGPARAVECARAMVASMSTIGVEIRAGLHTGECERRGADLAGIAVHVAARISALAAPGEVLVSRTVSDLVVGSGLEFGDRGEFDLGGVPGRWQLFVALPA